MRRLLSTTLLLFSINLLAEAAPAAQTTTADWTVLYYGAGDNASEASVMKSLRELSTAHWPKGARVLALADRAEGRDESPLGKIPAWKGARLLELAGTSWKLSGNLGEINSSSSAELRDFLSWGLQRSPAKHYALIIESTGAGDRGIGGDESHPDSSLMKGTDVAEAISGALSERGVARLDLVGFQASLSTTLEFLEPLGVLAEFAIGFPGFYDPRHWNSAAWASLIAAQQKSSALSAVIKQFPRSGLVQLSKIGALEKALLAWGKDPATPAALASSRLTARESLVWPRRDESPQLYVLADLVAGALKAHSSAAGESLLKLVVAAGESLSVHVPDTAPSEETSPSPGWALILGRVFLLQPRPAGELPPRYFTDPLHAALVTETGAHQSVRAAFATTGKDLMFGAGFRYGWLDGTAQIIWWRGESRVEISNHELGVTWSTRLPEIVQGSARFQVFAADSSSGGGKEFAVPMVLRTANGTEISVVLATSVGEKPDSHWIARDGQGCFSALDSSQEDLAYPLIASTDQAGNESWSVPDTAHGLNPESATTLDFTAFERGRTLVLRFEVLNNRDEKDWAAYKATY